jgi:SAM-dependent methyltransferase
MMPAVFYEVFRALPRQGPGSNEYTRRAWECLTGLPRKPHILDIGCGAGMQTLELARLSRGQVTALDNYPPFLDTLAANARATGLEKHIRIINGSMFDLPFAKGAFDVIWSEGAIFIIGFEKGLTEWKSFLKPDGFLVVSEMAWITPDRPEEVRAYMEKVDPAMKDDTGIRTVIRQAGYRVLGSFILPEGVWLDSFYKPYQARLDVLKQKYDGDEDTLAVLGECQQEIDIYHKYSRCYSYIYYVMQPVKGS